HSCSTNKTFPPNTTYESNLHTLLTSFSSVAATAEFYNTTFSGGDATGETIYGMFMCRGDIKSQKCQNCIEMATQKIALSCPNSKEAIIWYHECMVRYSNRSFFSTVDEWPRPKYISHHETSSITTEGSYGWLLATTLNDAIAEAAKSANANKKFATKHVSLGGFQNVYTLVQCTPDLSSQDCSNCLTEAITKLTPCCGGKQGGRVLFPSCFVRYELYPFYSSNALAPSPSPSAGLVPPPPATNSSNSGGSSGLSSGTIVAIVVPIAVAVLLFVAGVCFLIRRRARKKHDSAQDPQIREDLTDVESLQFDFATIEAATDCFSDENKIGQGGFGVVYKVRVLFMQKCRDMFSVLS
ncbi:hypothetical protein HN873_030335, partial [Arachis hypogaea]